MFQFQNIFGKYYQQKPSQAHKYRIQNTQNWCNYMSKFKQPMAASQRE